MWKMAEYFEQAYLGLVWLDIALNGVMVGRLCARGLVEVRGFLGHGEDG